MASLQYVQVSDLRDVLDETQQAQATDDDLGDDPDATPTRDTDMIERFLLRAENMADMHLVGYDRPVDPAPPALKYAILVLARYMLLERGDGDVDDAIQNSYDQAMNWLKNIRDGKIDLGGDPTEAIEDEVGFGTLGHMTFGELPFVDSSATIRSEPY